MKVAIINIKGHQYIVKEGQEILVDFLNKKQGEKIAPEKVVVLYEDNQIINDPEVLSKCKVELEVLENQKGQKVDVFRYKAKSRYRKRKGIRPILTKIKVNKIIC